MKKNILIFASFIAISFIMINCEKITPEALSSPKGKPEKPGDTIIPFIENVRKLHGKLVTVSQNQKPLIVKENGDIILDHKLSDMYNDRKVYIFQAALSDVSGLYTDQLFEERNPGSKKTLVLCISDNELYETGTSVALLEASFQFNLPISKIPIDATTASSRLYEKIAMHPITAYTTDTETITAFLRRIKPGKTRTLYGNKEHNKIEEVFADNIVDAERRTVSFEPIVLNNDGIIIPSKRGMDLTIVGVINENTCIGVSRGAFGTRTVANALTFVNDQLIILTSTDSGFSLQSSDKFFKESMRATDFTCIYSDT